MADPRERVVVAITGAPGTDALIREGARIADRTQGDLIGLHVRTVGGPASSETALLDDHIRLLTERGGEFHEVGGADVGRALVEFALAQGATHLVLGASRRSRWQELTRGSVINRAVRASGLLDVHVVSPEGGTGRRVWTRPSRRTRPIPLRRQLLGWLLVTVGIPALAAVLVVFRDSLELSAVLLLFLGLVVITAAVGGRGPALAGAVVGFLVANWFFTSPHHEVTIARAEDAVALFVFLGIAAVVSTFAITAARRTGDAVRARAEAETLAEANTLRTALLQAVSHDLRTPLAAIKASASSLREEDVEWSTDETREFARTIDEETDRLTALVDNLLDMGRLQAGALQPDLRAVEVEEVVPAALTSLGPRAARVDAGPTEAVDPLLADPALLERALANVVENAVRWSPPDRRVRVEADSAGDHVDLRVVDHGPGIDDVERDRVFLPFQRAGDGSDTGVGLGLAVARGFVQAMGGTVEIEDTPGGGATVVIAMPAATEPVGIERQDPVKIEPDGVNSA